MSEFSFENLEVYNKALDLVNRLFSICDKFPSRLQHSLGDQLRRASLSIVNNLAEGSDKRSLGKKKRFYEYALDSARECIPMLTICLKQDIIVSSEHDNLRESCTVICKMLRRLISSVH